MQGFWLLLCFVLMFQGFFFKTTLMVAFHLLIQKIFIGHLRWDSPVLNVADNNKTAKAMLSRAYILL